MAAFWEMSLYIADYVCKHAGDSAAAAGAAGGGGGAVVEGAEGSGRFLTAAEHAWLGMWIPLMVRSPSLVARSLHLSLPADQ